MIEFIKLTEREPAVVKIQLFGAGGMHPSMAMQYIDALEMGQVPVRCAGVTAFSNLLGSGDLALWLSLSLKRDIRPSASVYVPSGPVIEDTRYHHPLPLSWSVGHAAMLRDHEGCLERISEYVELDLVLDRWLSRHDLEELLLLPSAVDDLLARPLPPPSANHWTSVDDAERIFGSPEDEEGETPEP